MIITTILMIHNIKHKPHKGKFKKVRSNRIEHVVANNLKNKRSKK